MTLNCKALAASRGEKTIVEELKARSYVARLCTNPLIIGLMVSRPIAALELAAALGRPVEQKELVDALRKLERETVR